MHDLTGTVVAIIDGQEEELGWHDMWRLGEWSFNRIGREGSGEG